MSAAESENKPDGIAQKAQAAARSAAGTIKERAAETSAQLKDAATEMVEERRHQVADRIGGAGASLHETVRSVEAQDPNIAWFMEQASFRLQRAADYVRTCSWHQLRDDSASFARRHPVAFFGSMFAVGAAAGALVKAGISSGTTDDDESADPAMPPEPDETIAPGMDADEPFAPPYASSTAQHT